MKDKLEKMFETLVEMSSTLVQLRGDERDAQKKLVPVRSLGGHEETF